MKISPTHYNDAGELMAPRPFDVERAMVTPGGRPSMDPGFYHQFKFEGLTQAELEDKARRFFAEMAEVPGYMRLTLREYTVRMDSYVRYGLDVLYVIESPEGAPKPRVAFTETQSDSAPSTNVARRP
ncbi:hypothetical protein ACFVU2_19500 [Leifsonia sp. NPDC058194]|uniref:hypothetical protein n=1 Tax=Leifsonia sp. NPDC058194 TaxID=3346374 RepID=UPI0036DF604E